MYDERGACLEPGGHTGVEWRLSDLTSRMGSGFNVVRGCQLGRCFNNLPQQDDKGDVSAETTGPTWAAALADIQISVEPLAELWLISKSNK
ncbi:hypothetical protein V6N13_046219 [Hibiscus sabdariffa]